MVTYQQYLSNQRRTPLKRSSTPHFAGSPFRYGRCVRVGIVKPKKPNSAQRKIAKVLLSSKRTIIAYIPGFGHRLMKTSEVMVRGGRVPDLPGVRYHIMRFKKDLMVTEIPNRMHRRSKYGVKNPRERKLLISKFDNSLTPLSVRRQNQQINKEKRDNKLIIDEKVLKERFLKINNILP
jgi:small subunit ribosomal protein S12